MKKILHIITRLDRGGSSEDLLYSYRHFKNKGWDITVAFGRTLQPSSLFEEQRVTAADDFIPVAALVRRINPLLDVAAFVTILRLLFRERPAILHTHTSKAGIIGRFAGKLYSIVTGRSLFIVHSTHGHVFYGYYGSLLSRLFLLAEKLAAFVTDRIVVLTQNEVSEHLERGIGNREKFRIIHSGIEYRLAFTERDLRAKLAIEQKALVIGSVGRLDPVKGYTFLIDAAALVAKARPSCNCVWLIAGDGSEKNALEQRARLHGMGDKIIFAGWVENAADYTVITDIYVQPSLNEGMGKTVVLAQMLRRPVIATRVQGLASIIEDGRTGILVPPHNAAALADAIIRLIDDSDLRDRIGFDAQKDVFARDPFTGMYRFSVPYMNYLLERLYGAA